MSNPSKKLQKEVSFDKIRHNAVSDIMALSDVERRKLYDSLHHGVDLLDTEQMMDMYLFSYGKMHQAKVQKSLSSIDLSQFNNCAIDIVDWGCGQALATVCFLDILKTKGIDVKIGRITLIEPSSAALSRGSEYVKSFVDIDTEVIPVNKYIDDIGEQDIQNYSSTCFHFFSNILDIPSIDLKKLSERLVACSKGENFVFCIGPLNNLNKRIDRFYDYFNAPETFMNQVDSEYKYEVSSAPCSYNIKVFKLDSKYDNLVSLHYYPDVQFFASYRLDSVKNICKTDDPDRIEQFKGLYESLSRFEVSAPFDVGANVTDDVHPVLAVLNNIITRGLPTLAEPYLENRFSEMGNLKLENEYGAIEYDSDILSYEDVFLALHAIDSRYLLSENQYRKGSIESSFEKDFVFKGISAGIRQVLMPQRSLMSITGQNSHHSQRVDFSCQFPYRVSDRHGKQIKGCVIELDGDKSHRSPKGIRNDSARDQALKSIDWSILRLVDSSEYLQLKEFLSNDYFDSVERAAKKEFDKDWIATLQYTLSPIAVARIEKSLLEILISGRLNLSDPEWRILAIEKDVPCTVLALESFAKKLNTLCELSRDFQDIHFPKIILDIVSSKEFYSSQLHLPALDTGITVHVYKHARELVVSNIYDLILDIAVLRRSELEDNDYSIYPVKNDCYFRIRSSHYQRAVRSVYTSDSIVYSPIVFVDEQGLYQPIPEKSKLLQFYLQLLFRKEDFRPGQLPILNRALQYKSVIGLLPTGGGKSLTYQLAAMLQPGVTLVVDPLRSLMVDQYDGLQKVGIDTCTFINAILDGAEKEKRAKMMEASQLQFIFLSPERLCTYNFREKLRNMHNIGVYFCYGVIDEVHCVSEWGHDFRFTYLHLGKNLYQYVLPKQLDENKHIALFGLTATASFDVLADVERELSGDGSFEMDPETIIREENTNRLELQYKIERVPVQCSPDKYYDKNQMLEIQLPRAVQMTDKFDVYSSKQEFLKDYLFQLPAYLQDLQDPAAMDYIKERFNERQNMHETLSTDLVNQLPDDFFGKSDVYSQAAIVFCPHKNNTGISVNANKESLAPLIPDLGTFMGSSDDDNAEEVDKESFENLDAFRDNKLSLMIATKAFGMGIDKPNVRITVNMNYSSSLESFVQEAGRAGRDRKIALSTILLSDYRLVRINKRCPNKEFPMMIITNKWFKDGDLQEILDYYNIHIDEEYLDYCTPDRDMVKLHCDVCNTRFAFKLCNQTCNRCNKGPCQIQCPEYKNCQLRLVPDVDRGYVYKEDLYADLLQSGLVIPKRNYQYQNVDYETNMFFYNNNFKGTLVEKRTMYELLSKSTTPVFYGNDAEFKDTVPVSDFLQNVLEAEVGTEVVALISSIPIWLCRASGKKEKVHVLSKSGKTYSVRNIENGVEYFSDKDDMELLRDKSDIAKAIYRMCCIGFIDDFTEDYGKRSYRVVAKRKADGEYYKSLQRFLERYYTKERAEHEASAIPSYRGENEVQKCLGFLTEFIYEKIAVKRKQAIDDIRTFCLEGISYGDNWLEANEAMKDFIYYYFNSKYARNDYKTENGEDFSLVIDTDHGKRSSYEVLFKYMRVIDNDVVGTSSPKDNIKHLQGAVRLIRRAVTDINPTLDLLNVFCLLYLKVTNNPKLQEDLKKSYLRGYMDFYNLTVDKSYFYHMMESFKKALAQDNRDAASEQELEMLKSWDMLCEIQIHNKWLNNFSKHYLA